MTCRSRTRTPDLSIRKPSVYPLATIPHVVAAVTAAAVLVVVEEVVAIVVVVIVILLLLLVVVVVVVTAVVGYYSKKPTRACHHQPQFIPTAIQSFVSIGRAETVSGLLASSLSHLRATADDVQTWQPSRGNESLPC
ncbi:hypothetical protein ElyMa_006089900 [Elysia marginata]|uniref:Uncharacterized protein n=1 Tax=Elysia marginata TaxID=1093978 RepID=A0AAV4GQB0_9GAST|nr:hypothetical protein ElyMa_006089900 [Elysia marginata]